MLRDADDRPPGADGPDVVRAAAVVDFGTVITAVLAIAGLLAGVYVAIKGAKIVIGMVRGA